MKKTANLFYFGLFATLYGCIPGIGEWDISELYALKIEGSSKIVYKYDAWGGLDSHVNGYIILDSTDTFKVNVKEELPLYFLYEIPNKNKITGVTHKCDNGCEKDYKTFNPNYIPIEIEMISKEKIEIKNIIYQSRGFAERGGGLERFHFDSFKEEKDSLFFYNLDDVESLNGIHLDSLKLKKKMVLIQQNDSLEVKMLVLEDLRISEKDNEILSNITYFLTPKNKIKVGEFSDYGIFKPVRVK